VLEKLSIPVQIADASKIFSHFQHFTSESSFGSKNSSALAIQNAFHAVVKTLKSLEGTVGVVVGG
jgi:hypothetical protein